MNSNSGQLQLNANDALVAQTAQIGVFRAHLTPPKSAYDARSRHPPLPLFWQRPQPVAIWNAGGNAGVAIHAATICINSLQNPTAQYPLAGGAPSGDCFDPANVLADDPRADGTALRPPPASESARRAPTRADARLPAGPDGTNCFDCTQAAGPRFKAYVQQNATGDALMADTALAVAATATSPAIPAHPGTVTIEIEMRCDDADTSGFAAADHALFAERVVRFFDYIGPCVAPAKMHRWTVGFGWSGQRT